VDDREHYKGLKRAALRGRNKERLRAQEERNKSKTAPVPPPRYDEVFYDGVAALDAC
jgi:hypothetical protein